MAEVGTSKNRGGTKKNVALTYCFKSWRTQRKLASLTLKGSTLWLANSHVRQIKLNVLQSFTSFHCIIINIQNSLTYRYADACAFSVCYVMKQNNHRSYTDVAAIYHEHYLCEPATFEDWWKHDHKHHILQVDRISVSALPHELPVTNMATKPLVYNICLFPSFFKIWFINCIWYIKAKCQTEEK